MEDLKVKPGEVVQLQLDVFASIRIERAPTLRPSFHSRVSVFRKVSKKIESGTKALMKEKKVLNALKAKGLYKDTFGRRAMRSG